MTTSELSQFIGQEGRYKTGSMTVNVRIIDTRKHWDRIDCLIQPVAGEGQQWVALTSLQLKAGS